jgi:hypothetical protein
VVTPRRPVVNKYEYIYLGDYFSCNNFGHNAIDYRAYPRNDQRRNGGMYNAPRYNYVYNKVKNVVDNRNISSFSPLLNYDLECYKFHNFGYKCQYCKSWIHAPIENHNVVSDTTKVLKKKQEKSSLEECDLAMHAQDKEIYWYIDNGCSKTYDW